MVGHTVSKSGIEFAQDLSLLAIIRDGEYILSDPNQVIKSGDVCVRYYWGSFTILPVAFLFAVVLLLLLARLSLSPLAPPTRPLPSSSPLTFPLPCVALPFVASGWS